MGVLEIITGTSSTSLRVFAYLFLQWIPGHHFVPIIFSLFAVYVGSSVTKYWRTLPYEVVLDEVKIITSENSIDKSTEDDGSLDSGTQEPGSTLLQVVEISEQVVLAPKSPTRICILVSGIPCRISPSWSALTFGINALLVLATVDVVYRGPLFYKSHELSFARVGFVSYESAKILVREPHVSSLPITAKYRFAGPPLSAAYSNAMPESSWSFAAQIDALTDETDFTSTITIPRLQPDTRYQYSLSNNHTGFFTTAPKPGHLPASSNDTFTFLFTSCIKPRFPYSPLMHPLSLPGLKTLGALIPNLKAQFMLFMGDFIYIDVPHRFGEDVETYRSDYRRVYSSPEWEPASNELPWLHVIDDHEIANDWDQNTTGLYRAAADPFMHYHVAANPDPFVAGETYMAFTQGPVSIFMLDTRRYRTPESKDTTDPTKSMLGEEQLAALLDWISTPPEHPGIRWKVFVSSVPFTKNWRFGDTDTWGTYLYERSIILEAAWKASRAQGVGIIVISGDRHEFAATRFPDPDHAQSGEYENHTTDVLEFSVSPLNMFYLPIKTYKQLDDEDVEILYAPNGQQKFGAIDVSINEVGNSVLKFRLFVGGMEKWSFETLAPKKQA